MSNIVRKIEVEVGYSNSVLEFYDIEKIKLSFTQDDLDQIKKCQAFMEENKNVFKMLTNFNGGVLFDSEGNETDEFPTSGGMLIIFKDHIYYFEESKYDASGNFESVEITNEQLF